MAVHTTIRYQAHQVKRTPLFCSILDSRQQSRIVEKVAVFYFIVDTHQVLAHHSTTTQGHVSDFGIAHLAIRQPHRAAAGIERGMGVSGEIFIKTRCSCFLYRVINTTRVDTEPI